MTAGTKTAPPPHSVGLKKAIIITQEIVDGEVVSQRELEQNLTNHNDLEVSGEDQELTEQLELAVEEAKAEEQELTEQLELAVENVKAEEEKVVEQLELSVEKVKSEEEKVVEQLELAVEKVKAEEEFTELPLAKEDELVEDREVTC